MDSGRNIYTDMEVDSCKSCHSNCCSLEVDLTKSDYDKLKLLGKSFHATKRSDLFIRENPQYTDKIGYLDEMYGHTFAVINQGEDGYCNFLDRRTRLCTIYNNRPSICRDFQFNNSLCKQIKSCGKSL